MSEIIYHRNEPTSSEALFFGLVSYTTVLLLTPTNDRYFSHLRLG